MPSFQYIGLQQATTKVLDLWDPVMMVNSAPPTGWSDPGFDDSGWATSVDPTTGTIGVPGPLYNPTAGTFPTASLLPDDTEAIAPWVTPPDPLAGFALRAHFSNPGGVWKPYLLEGFWSNYFSGAGENYGFWGPWINGTFCQVWFEALDQLVDGDNVIAFVTPLGFPIDIGQAWTSTVQGFISFRFTFYVPDPGGQANAWGTITPGVNDKGVLGTGDTNTYLVPTQCSPTLPANIVKIASNGLTTLFLTADGEVWACGDNSTGLLGIGQIDDGPYLDPLRIFPNTTYTRAQIADIAIGFDCAMALSRTRTCYVWGPNTFGSYGVGAVTPFYSPGYPLLIPGQIGIRQMAVGGDFSVVQSMENGYPLYSSGNNSVGQLAQNLALGPGVNTFDLVHEFDGGTDTICQGPNLLFAAGDGRLVSSGSTSNGNQLMGAGNGATGSLSNSAYTNFLFAVPNNRLIRSSSRGPYLQMIQAGQMSFFTLATSGELGVIGGIIVIGDGRPYGGAGDWLGTVRYGDNTNLEGFVQRDSSFDALVAASLATCGASTNPFLGDGNSQSMMAAVGADGLLYTWGYGGFGQMGNTGLVATNLRPITGNGLTNVVCAAVANQIAFAAGLGGTPSLAGHGRAWGQIIGA